MDIWPTAHRHGIAEADMLHAVEHSLGCFEEGVNTTLCLGPDRAGNLLEVVVAEFDDGTETIIHAMPMRRGYEPLLRGLEDQ